MSHSSQAPEPAPRRQRASRKRNRSPLASLEKYFVGFTVRSYPWTYRFCFSWRTDVDCVMLLLSQTDLGMVKCAKARNAKCFKKELHTGLKRGAMERKALGSQREQRAALSAFKMRRFLSVERQLGQALCSAAAYENQIFSFKRESCWEKKNTLTTWCGFCAASLFRAHCI